MTKEDNIRAILETHFTWFREDIIESAVKMIMDVTEERHGITLITDRPYKAGEGGVAVHLHDNVYIDTGCYCDRNICTENEYNGVSCDTCYIAQNYNLEDDDTPCQNCGEDDDANETL